MRFQAIPLSFMAKMMAGAMKPMLGTVVKCIEEDLDDLKTALEGAS